MQVSLGAELVHGFESRKALALLCYLAVRGQPVTRDHLAELFWPMKSPLLGRGNLSRVLHNLGTLLPRYLVADRYTVALSPRSGCWLDTAAFEGLAAQGTALAQAKAIEHYRGEFLADLYLDDCAEFELWMIGERERWLGRVVGVMHGLVATHLRQRDVTEGLRLVTRLLDLQPWREETHRQAMELLAASGQRSAALMHFESCRRTLKEYLGVEPLAETRALRDRIATGEYETGVAART